jgi:hypothetical protein
MRAITYLAPGIPLGFYETVLRHVSGAIGGAEPPKRRRTKATA